jgi:hypothetical protein
MIVSFLRQFAYVGPPKTASTSLHEWLSQPLLCERLWNPKQGDQHESQVPPEARGFFTFASIRNPYSRAVSLWCHGLASGEMDRPPIPRFEFPEFVERLPDAAKFYGASQTEWLSGIQLDAVLRIERIEEILDLPPFSPLKNALEPIPRLNFTEHEQWQRYYDRRLAEMIFRHFREDFDAFGYGKELRPDG